MVFGTPKNQRDKVDSKDVPFKYILNRCSILELLVSIYMYIDLPQVILLLLVLFFRLQITIFCQKDGIVVNSKSEKNLDTARKALMLHLLVAAGKKKPRKHYLAALCLKKTLVA